MVREVHPAHRRSLTVEGGLADRIGLVAGRAGPGHQHDRRPGGAGDAGRALQRPLELGPWHRELGLAGGRRGGEDEQGEHGGGRLDRWAHASNLADPGLTRTCSYVFITIMSWQPPTTEAPGRGRR